MTSKLGEICARITSGGTPKSTNPAYYGGSIPWLRTQEVDFVDIERTEMRITQEGYDNSSAKWIPANAVIVAMYGATAGKCAISKIPLTTNQACCNLIVDDSKADYRYVYYQLKLNYSKLLGLANGGAQQNLSAKIISDYEIDLPPLARQRAIADMLSALDAQITSNTAINHHLEQMAQAIFKSWFVDFEPWGGEIPSDWRTGNLLGIADYLNGLAMQRFRPADGEAGLPVLKIKELRQKFCDSSSELCSQSIRSDYIIHDGDVIFSWSGSLIVDFWCGGDCGLNQHLFKVTSTKYDKWFYYGWTCHHLDQFIAMAADKATTMGHIKREALQNAEVLIPSAKDYAAVGKLLAPLYEQVINNRVESRKLALLRDSLLPRLMSGELSVADLGDGK